MKQRAKRVLLVDDNSAIHDDYRKILEFRHTNSHLAEAKAALFGIQPVANPQARFELTHATQGEEALNCVRDAVAEGRPFAVAFVDVRMPPGWNGIETTARMWEIDPTLQVVICTAYSDYSWNDIKEQLGESDNLLILKKPFDNIEVLQFAHALTAKWQLMRDAQTQIEALENAVNQRTRELRQSEERFSKAFNTNPLPICIQSVSDQKIVDANPAFYQLLDRRPEDVINRKGFDIGLEDLRLDQLAPNGNRSGTSDASTVLRTRLGTERNVLVFADQFEAAGVTCRIVLLQDITERMKIEAELRQAHKMEAIGRLAAGVAHDFNNILTVIQGHLSLALMNRPLDPAITGSLKQASQAGDRAATLIRQLLAFSRKQAVELRPINLATLLEQIRTMLRPLIGDTIGLNVASPLNLPCAMADRCNIEQILINLAVNARDAMPNGGELFIDAFAVDAESQQRESVLSGSDRDFVCLRVRDTGSGMDDSTKARIFEPFFTTKQVGVGTGLGLATVQGIVKQHHGWVEVDSALGAGSTFRVFLPSTPEKDCSATLTPFEVSSTRRQARETILVVEDEKAVAEFAEKLLVQHGYRVLVAADAAAALAIWAAESDRIALLFTDLVMPGAMGGRKLADLLVEQKPALRVIVTSGYGVDSTSNKGGLGTFLQKPYSATALLKLVERSFEIADRECRKLKGAVSVESVAIAAVC